MTKIYAILISNYYLMPIKLIRSLFKFSIQKNMVTIFLYYKIINLLIFVLIYNKCSNVLQYEKVYNNNKICKNNFCC